MFSTPTMLLATAALLPSLASAAGSFGDPGKELWMWHGILMMLSWCVVFPTGALLAVYRRQVGETGNCLRWAPSFYPPHLYCQMLGIVMNIVAVGLAAAGSFEVYGTGNPFDDVLWLFESTIFPWNRHVKWGMATLTILTGQSILGYVHHLIKHRHDAEVARAKESGEEPKPWKRWIVPSWAHVIIGPLSIIVAYLTVIQGFQIWAIIFEGPQLREDGAKGISPAIQFGYAAVGLCGVAFAIAYVAGKWHDHQEVKSDQECMRIKVEEGTAV